MFDQIIRDIRVCSELNSHGHIRFLKYKLPLNFFLCACFFEGYSRCRWGGSLRIFHDRTEKNQECWRMLVETVIDSLNLLVDYRLLFLIEPGLKKTRKFGGRQLKRLSAADKKKRKSFNRKNSSNLIRWQFVILCWIDIFTALLELNYGWLPA